MNSVLLVEVIVVVLAVLAVAVAIVVSIVRRRGPEEPPVEESGPGSITMYPGVFLGPTAGTGTNRLPASRPDLIR